MLKILSLVTSFLFSFSSFGFADIDLEQIKGEKIQISQFKGKTVLVVNIATKCGLTGQLDDLEKLYQKYKSKGLVVLGVPSNDFLGQTPEGNEEVADFCRLNYGVSFPLIEKMSVKGESKSEFYKSLLAKAPKPDTEVSWNFEKFLIDAEGKVVSRFLPKVAPLGGELEEKISSLVK